MQTVAVYARTEIQNRTVEHFIKAATVAMRDHH